MQENIHSIVQIFPNFEDKIEFLLATDENFKDLCSDYMLCSSSITEIKKDLTKYMTQIEEYEDVQQNLEQEILKLITK